MDAAAPAPSQSKSAEIDVTPSANFDLDTYAANYVSHTKIDRLLLISNRSKKLRNQALQSAITELKKGQNTIMYRKLFEKLGDELGSGFTFDAPWADSVDKRAAQTLERLEMELNGSKTNLIKENIRVRTRPFPLPSHGFMASCPPTPTYWRTAPPSPPLPSPPFCLFGGLLLLWPAVFLPIAFQT
jgi:hypothetical protein